MLRKQKGMDDKQAWDALYGGPRTVRAEPLARKAHPKRVGERVRRRLDSREKEEAA